MSYNHQILLQTKEGCVKPNWAGAIGLDLTRGPRQKMMKISEKASPTLSAREFPRGGHHSMYPAIDRAGVIVLANTVGS